ncbi:MAG: hypothetical protein B7733_19480 [Myxococcales bacterium FL481]|nr:MAG: hypothetical protein B7733_19480 [Myxococcales bacterium FL481]
MAFAAGLAVGCSLACATTSGSHRAAQDRERAEKHYAVALASFHNGMFEDAKLQLNRALAADLEHADSHYLLGVIRLQAGKSILDAVERDVCLRDEAADRQRIRADDLHREAHESFAAAADHYPEQSAGRGRAYNSMAVVSLHFQRLERAQSEAKRALAVEFYSERYSAYANLGWAYYVGGDLVGAVTELRQSVMVNPDFCVGRYRLARAYLDYGMPEAALEEIQRVVQDARCPIQDAYRVQGVASQRTGLDAEAKAAFESCMQAAPRSCLASTCRDLL